MAGPRPRPCASLHRLLSAPRSIQQSPGRPWPGTIIPHLAIDPIDSPAKAPSLIVRAMSSARVEAASASAERASTADAGTRIWYTGDRLDWAEDERSDAAVEALRAHPDARVLLRRPSDRGAGGHFAFVKQSPDSVLTPVLSPLEPMTTSRLVFLGRDTASGNAPVFAMDTPDGGGATASGDAAASTGGKSEGGAGAGGGANEGTGQQSSPSSTSRAAASVDGVAWLDVRTAGGAMSADDAAMVARANGLLSWHRRTRFCASCGSGDLSVSKGGLRLTCPSCRQQYYPQVDPAVIASVSCGPWVLLGRKAAWKQGRYSCLAGFTEMGEALEDAVVREVAEEAGVRVQRSSVRFVASQPWPMPRSLMVGFHAEAIDSTTNTRTMDVADLADTKGAKKGTNLRVDKDGDGAMGGAEGGGALAWEGLSEEGRAAAGAVGITEAELREYLGCPAPPRPRVDVEELEDARWFHADFLARALRGGRGGSGVGAFGMPGREALARHLVERWLEERARAAWAGDAIADVEISEGGAFKYILARVSEKGSGRSKLVVRGHIGAAYHAHVLDKLVSGASIHGLECRVLGGGRIEHYADSAVPALGGAVSIYGYSMAFGPAPHEVTAAILRRWLPLYDESNFSVSYEGY